MEFEKKIIDIPPLFKGQKYELWKERMVNFLNYMDEHLLAIIEEGIPTLFDSFGELFPGEPEKISK